MKKNAMLKIAAILLVAVLLTTCAISATFAKYTTNAALAKAATARVARWGIQASVTATGTGNVFKNAYELSGNTVVASVDDKEVVAPGTTSDSKIELAIKFKDPSKKPEVAYKVTPVVTATLNGWDEYFPIQFIVSNGTDKETVTVNAANLPDGTTDLSDAVSKALTAQVKTFFPDAANAAEAAEKTVTITWQWPASVDDGKDTILGDKDVAPTISITASLTIDQIVGDTELAK